MHILFISNGFPPGQWAGTETYTAGLARELAARGYRVDVLCGGEWSTGARYWNGVTTEEWHGVRVIRLNVNWTKAHHPFRYLYDNPEVARYLREYLRQDRPDVMHVTSCERLSASVIATAKDAKVPVVLSLTDFWFLCPRMTLLRGDGQNCSGETTGWECTECQAGKARVVRWPRAFLPSFAVPAFVSRVGQVPFLARRRGVRGLVGDIDARRAFLRSMFSRVDFRVTASAFVRDRFLANGFDAPITVRPYGHDVSWLGQAPEKTPSHRLRVGFIGQLVRQKGVHVLLEALGRLPETIQQGIQIRIYGDTAKAPHYSAELARLAQRLPAVEFMGTYDRDMTGEVFAGIDVLAVPSLWFDFPLIIHESFAARTPVVATRLAGMAETVRHGVNGLLFERGDVAGLAAHLEMLAKSPGRVEELRAGIGPVKSVQADVDDLEHWYGNRPATVATRAV